MSKMEEMALSMLSKAFGISPEQMQQTMTNSMELLKSISERFEAIENHLVNIEKKLDMISENYTHEPVSIEQGKYLEAQTHVNGNTKN